MTESIPTKAVWKVEDKMKKIQWGIIGCGDVCERKSGPAFYKIKNSSLTAVMRRDIEKAKDYAFRHAVPHYCDNAEQLINDPNVNAIYVATPPDTHKAYTIKAMRAGKPVYVEKPMALDYNECAEMVKASQETGQKLFVAHYRRALPYFLKVKELIDNEKVGKILTVNTQYFRAPSASDINADKHTWRVNKAIAGGGYFYDLAPHTLDILDFLLGKIEDATGITENLGGFYAVEDTVSALLKFKSGAQGTAQWSFVTSVERDTIEIIGTKGMLHFNTFAFQPIVLKTVAGKTEQYEPEQPEHIQQPLIQTIVNELQGIGECASTGITALRTAWVIDKIFERK